MAPIGHRPITDRLLAAVLLSIVGAAAGDVALAFVTAILVGWLLRDE